MTQTNHIRRERRQGTGGGTAPSDTQHMTTQFSQKKAQTRVVVERKMKARVIV